MVSELQAENNRLHRLFQQFSAESKALTIASVALIITVLALLMSFMALDAAKDAKIHVEYQDTDIAEIRENYEKEILQLENKITLYLYHVQNLELYLKSEGLNPPPPEK